jgi:hypothetical protein
VIYVRVHPSVRRIKSDFYRSSHLTIVFLGEGVEEIGELAFYGCTSLREIVIPPAIRVLNDLTFRECSELMIVVLGKGLEEIGWRAFSQCPSLRQIQIPPAVRAIEDCAFHGCRQ